MIEIEHYTYSDNPGKIKLYEMIRSWAPDRFPVPELLPKLGVIAWEDKTPIAFLCADMSNSVPRAFIDYMMTNPDLPTKTRFKAVKVAEKFLCERLKAKGYQVVMGVSRFAGVASLARMLGYTPSTEPLVEFNKQI